jgi:hypothetical protein
MIRSMTGFGKATAVYEDKTVSVEIKSINHRYFEMYARTPRSCMQLEDLIRTHLQKRIVRGKIEVNVNISFSGSEDVKIAVNKELFKSYLDAFSELSEEFSLKNDESKFWLTPFSITPCICSSVFTMPPLVAKHCTLLTPFTNDILSNIGRVFSIGICSYELPTSKLDTTI